MTSQTKTNVRLNKMVQFLLLASLLLVLNGLSNAQFVVETVPMNDGMVTEGSELYCRISYQNNGTVVNTQWFIEGSLIDDSRPFDIEFFLGPPPANTNLTINTLGSFDGPSVSVWCAPEGAPPDTRLANFTVSRFPGIIFGFDQPVVTVSESVRAVVCVRTIAIGVGFEGDVFLPLRLVQGSATDMVDYNSSTIPTQVNDLLFAPPFCFPILTLEDNISEGVESFSIQLLPPVIDPGVPILISPDTVQVRIVETCIDGEVRLRGGFDELQGRVEVCFSTTWGTVCDNGWDDSDAFVVCFQLGLLDLGQGGDSIIIAFGSAFFGQGTGPILLNNVQCTSEEPTLSSCPNDNSTSTTCTHDQDASVDCFGPREFGEPCLVDGDVRLVDGQDEFQGRVEVCYSGVWGTICDIGWDFDDADVVCRQLGYDNPTRIFDSGETVPGTSSIALTNVNCVGDEPTLMNCTLPSFFPTGCTHSQDVGVDCLGRRRGQICSTDLLDGRLRLINGADNRQGRVEVCYGGVWGTVCDDFWDNADARVVCRQLGLNIDGAAAYQSAAFGEGVDPITLDDVMCIGNESRLVDCPQPSFFEDDCGHQKDASVDCVGPRIGFERNLYSVREGQSLEICIILTSGEIRDSISFRVAGPFNVDDGDEREPGGEGDLVEQLDFVTGGIVPPSGELSFAFSDDFSIEYPNPSEPFLTLTATQTRACVNVNTQNNSIVMGSRMLPLSVGLVPPERYSTSRRSTLIFIVDDDLNCAPEEIVCVDLMFITAACVSGICDGIMDCMDGSDELNCPDTGVLDNGLQRILGQNLTNDTYGELTEDLSETLTSTEDSPGDQNTENLGEVARFVEDLATFVNSSGVTVEPTVVRSLVGTLDSLLVWDSDVLINDNTSVIVSSFESVAAVFAQQIETGSNQTYEFTNVVFLAENTGLETLQDSGRGFTFSENDGAISIELGDGVTVTPGELNQQEVAAIRLPASLFQDITDNRTNVGVFFAVYSVSHLFPVTQNESENANNRTTVVGSRILASTVGPGLDFINLTEPVSIILRIVRTEPRDNNSIVCVSWSFLLNDWITDGCGEPIPSDTDPNVFTCNCTHLTNFALLVDICTRVEDCARNEVLEKVLSFITYIGAGISMVCLIITIITLIFFKKLRQRDASKYHIQLSIAIFCMLLVFVVGVERTERVGGCVTVSFLIHYFTLVAVMWMGAEALLMFQKLVIVFVQITTKYIIAVSLVCWLVPLIPVVIPLIVDLAIDASTWDIVIRSDQFCFLNHPGAFFGAFLALIFIVIIFNLVMFIIVIYVLIKHTRGQLSRQQERMKPATAVRLMISITGVMFLFGLTWLFAALTITVPGVRYTFQILFTVFTAFQGFFIFLFFCLLNKEAREFWKEVLTCGKYKSDLLHPSKYKASSTGGIGKKKQTVTTGLATSSTGKSSNVPFDSHSEIAMETLDGEKKINDNKNKNQRTEIELSKEEEAMEMNTPAIVEMKIDEEISQQPATASLAMASPPKDVEKQESSEAPPKKKKSKGGLSLKARIKRYSTKKAAKHHVEVAEVDFHSDDESGSEDDENRLSAI